MMKIIISLTILSVVLAAAGNNLRVCSWNILADFFDKTDYPQHLWAARRPYVLQAIQEQQADVFGLQEMSPEQVAEMARGLPGYELYTLCQHENGDDAPKVPAGCLAKGLEVESWIGKNVGTPLAAVLWRSDRFECLDRGRFWLSPTPDALPIHQDRGATDKGFGNKNTNRAVLWVKLRDLASGRLVFAFNSHYPLDGNDGTRTGCAGVERRKIQEIAGDNFWVSMGDRNTVGPKRGAAQAAIIGPLFEIGHNVVSEGVPHEGPSGTWAGFLYDRFKAHIDENGQLPGNPDVLDFMVASIPADASAHILPVFEAETGLLQYNPVPLQEDRAWASDHLMVRADFTI